MPERQLQKGDREKLETKLRSESERSDYCRVVIEDGNSSAWYLFGEPLLIYMGVDGQEGLVNGSDQVLADKVCGSKEVLEKLRNWDIGMWDYQVD